VYPVKDPLLLRKSGSARNQTQTSGSVARNPDHEATSFINNIHFPGIHTASFVNLQRLFSQKRSFAIFNIFNHDDSKEGISGAQK
jgi:hypothetical protein